MLLTTTAFAAPIHVAAEDGDLAGVQAELDKGVDVNVNNKLVGSGGGTPLHYATTKAIAELLIANGADVNAQNDYGETPLDYDAWYNSETEIADLLREHGGKHGVINGAAAGGNIEAVKEFLVAGTDVNVKDGWGWTPLHNAAWWGHKEIAELLLANGADVNAKDDGGDTPLDVAILRNDKETADLLRKHGGKTTEELEEIFHAIEDGDFEAVNKAISDGFDFNNAIFEGQTPLYYAATKEITELLIAKGADVNAKHEEGWTP